MNRISAICGLVEMGAPRFSLVDASTVILAVAIYDSEADLMARIMLAALLVLWHFVMLVLTASAEMSRIGQAYLKYKQGEKTND
jgi:hypothetical protein